MRSLQQVAPLHLLWGYFRELVRYKLLLLQRWRTVCLLSGLMQKCLCNICILLNFRLLVDDIIYLEDVQSLYPNRGINNSIIHYYIRCLSHSVFGILMSCTPQMHIHTTLAPIIVGIVSVIPECLSKLYCLQGTTTMLSKSCSCYAFSVSRHMSSS